MPQHRMRHVNRLKLGYLLLRELYLDGGHRILQVVRLGSTHDGRSAMLRAVEELIECAETGSTPRSSAIDARADLEIAVAFHLAHQSGGRVTLPLTDPSALSYTIEDPWGRAPRAPAA